jgi:hypothetical protein
MTDTSVPQVLQKRNHRTGRAKLLWALSATIMERSIASIITPFDAHETADPAESYTITLASTAEANDDASSNKRSGSAHHLVWTRMGNPSAWALPPSERRPG